MASAPGHGRYVAYQHDGSHTPLLRSYSSSTSSDLDGEDPPPPPPPPPPSHWSQWRAKAESFWLQGKGMILVTVSQFFGANMNVMTKYLEMNGSNGEGMDPFQVHFTLLLLLLFFFFPVLSY